MTNQSHEMKATITLDAANNDRDFPAYQLSINAMRSESNGHGYRLMGPKYVGRSRNLRTSELSQRDADEIRAILDEVFPLPQRPSRAEVLREAADEMDAHCEKYGVLGVGDRLRRMAEADTKETATS